MASAEIPLMKLKVVEVPALLNPIAKSPGFAKKQLADWKLDVMGLCGFGCRYCSSNEGNYLRINRQPFADLTEEQLGERVLPTDDPALTFVMPDVIEHLERQLHGMPKGFGAGETLVVSMLTDAFSPPPIKDGTTEAALKLVLARTSFRVRVLTKSAIVGRSSWIEFFLRHPKRFVVGLSTGTLDDEWARRVEVNTSSPSSRLRALCELQDAGVPTFGMLCPVFPDAVKRDALAELIDAIRPALCEHVWAEPFNDRSNWKAVRDGYATDSPGYAWLTRVYADGDRDAWSSYATKLYRRLARAARRDGWIEKLRFLLYEGGITTVDAQDFRGLNGVLLQSPSTDGWSKNVHIRALQQHAGHGYV
jgi:DNA repair photolyase